MLDKAIDQGRRMTAFISFTRDGTKQRFPCKEVTTIGRDVSNDVVLDDPLVSRRHAMICRLQGDTYYLIDEGSSNGSYLNAKRVALPSVVNNGDSITIGAANIRFERIGNDSPSARVTDSRETTVILQPSVEVVKTSILVADIRGFTRLSESMPVRELTEVMNEWFRAATGCIKDRYGIVDKFLGDCVYARWDGADDPARAVRRAVDAACNLARISQGINASHPTLPQPLGIGAGINFGIAAIGTDQGHTAIGDAVNLTFRLQEQTKRLNCNLLLAQDAYTQLSDASWSGREQSISVSGKALPVNVCGYSFEEAEAMLRTGEETKP
jgi:adenylate cyclase